MLKIKNLRKNSFKFLLVMYMMDLFWLFLIYIIGESEVFNYNSIESSVMINAGLQTGIAISVTYLITNIKSNFNYQIIINQGALEKIVYISFFFNLFNFYLNQFYSRYEAGQLTGLFGIYYVVSLGLNIAAFSLLIRVGADRKKIKLMMALHGFSMFGRVDGIAEILVLISMIYIYIVICGIKTKILSLFMIFFYSILVLYGVQVKLGESFTTNYLVEYMPMWTVERLAIHSYQWEVVLNGGSIIKNLHDFIITAWNSFLLRIDLLCNCNLGNSSLPKSISEAMYYDLYGLYGSGSSPGVMTSISLMGPLGLLVIYWNAIISRLIFSNIEFKFGYFGMIAFGVAYKILYVDISEYLAIVSPVTLIFITVLTISFVKVNKT